MSERKNKVITWYKHVDALLAPLHFAGWLLDDYVPLKQHMLHGIERRTNYIYTRTNLKNAVSAIDLRLR